jgi:hypothetical protein
MAGADRGRRNRVTQHWIVHRYRMPFDEITAVEPVHGHLRWFLRVHCDERTFEVIPSHTLLPWALSSAIGPPCALIAARQHIEQSVPADLHDYP